MSKLPICCLCEKQMLPDTRYQVFGFVSNLLYAHTNCEPKICADGGKRMIFPLQPWVRDEINGERIEDD